MLSYRHSYHAGNFADVLKHIVLIDLLVHLTKKEKSFDYIDTHAGAGVYSLISQHAGKNQEFHNGIALLKPKQWPELTNYFSIIDQCNPDAGLQNYPGSPYIASQFFRQKDQGWLYELHPADFKLLDSQFQGFKRIHTHKQDGFQGLLSKLPPASRRALTLIDPSYEIKDDYTRIITEVKKAHRKFPTGMFAIWYPVVDRNLVNKLEKDLIRSGIKNIQLYELGLKKDTEEHGMTSSGMIIINPPWTQFDRMQSLLPRLVTALNTTDEAFYRCEELVGE